MLEVGRSSIINHDYNKPYINRMEYMVSDAMLANQNVRDKEPTTWQEPFYNMVQVTQITLI